MGRRKIKELEQFIKKVQKRFGPAKIILFGSRARGDFLKTSDWDILIVSEAFAKYDFHARIVEVLKLIGKPMNLEIICLTPEEFELKRKQLSIIRVADREGVELYA